MKDFRHIRFYESLLEQTNNELVRQAKAAGGVAVGIGMLGGRRKGGPVDLLRSAASEYRRQR